MTAVLTPAPDACAPASENRSPMPRVPAAAADRATRVFVDPSWHVAAIRMACKRPVREVLR